MAEYDISRPIYRYLSSHRLTIPPDNVPNHALEVSNVCCVMVFSEFTFGDGHSDAFDAFCRSKITKKGISRPIYHYLSSHILSCPPDNVSNDGLEGSNVCLVLVFIKFTFGDGHFDAFDAFCRSKITKKGFSMPIYPYLS